MDILQERTHHVSLRQQNSIDAGVVLASVLRKGDDKFKGAHGGCYTWQSTIMRLGPSIYDAYL